LLVAALKSKDKGVQVAAAVALGKIGDARAVEPLIAALWAKGTKNREVQEVAVEALGEIGDARAVAPLVGLATDSDSGTARSGVYVLKDLLERVATQVPTETLREITASKRFFEWQMYEAPPGCSMVPTWHVQDVEASSVKQLARQELIRRGLKA
jgi:HEAT repeat protein